MRFLYSIICMHHKEPLCKSYDPFREHPFIYNKVFLPGRVRLSLRPFHIGSDLPLINNWFNFQFAQAKNSLRDPFQYTEDYYTTLLTGANSQPLLGMIDRNPAFQVDIYQAILGPDSLMNAGNFADTDFIMQLMVAPDTLRNLSLFMYTIVACLDCFFGYQEVNRLIWMTNTREKSFHFIAGITELEEIQCTDDQQSYFIISKQRFKQVQYGLPIFPEQQEMAADY